MTPTQCENGGAQNFYPALWPRVELLCRCTSARSGDARYCARYKRGGRVMTDKRQAGGLRCLCCNAIAPVPLGMTPRPLNGPQDENRLAPWRQGWNDGGWVSGSVAVSIVGAVLLTFFWGSQFCCGRLCPSRRFCWPQRASSSRGFAPQSASLQGPRCPAFLLSGRLATARQVCAYPFAAPRARHCVRPRSGSLEAVGRLCARAFVVASQACLPLLATPSRLHTPTHLAMAFHRDACLATCPRLQRLGLYGDGPFSLASELDAGGSFG